MATHFKFLIVKVPDVVRQMGLEASCGVCPRGVSSSTVLSVECGKSVISVQPRPAVDSVSGEQCSCGARKAIKKGSPRKSGPARGGLNRTESMA